MLQRKTGLTPGPGPKRKKGLCAQSRAMRRTKAEQKKAYAAAADAEQDYCSACGIGGPVVHSHILTQGMHKPHRNSELNWLQFGRYCSCHDLWENHKADFARQYPVVYAETLRRMELVDPKAFHFYLSKNPPAGAPTTQEGSRRH